MQVNNQVKCFYTGKLLVWGCNGGKLNIELNSIWRISPEFSQHWEKMSAGPAGFILHGTNTDLMDQTAAS